MRFFNRNLKSRHSERSIHIGSINRNLKSCHSGRSIAIGFINRNAQSRNLLSLAVSDARGARSNMPTPEDSSQPRLAAGCRWGPEQKSGAEEVRVILFPEGAIKLQGTGRQVLERCDGQRTFAQIIQELQTQFAEADPAKIRADISQFLEQLRHKRIVDY